MRARSLHVARGACNTPPRRGEAAPPVGGGRALRSSRSSLPAVSGSPSPSAPGMANRAGERSRPRLRCKGAGRGVLQGKARLQSKRRAAGFWPTSHAAPPFRLLGPTPGTGRHLGGGAHCTTVGQDLGDIDIHADQISADDPVGLVESLEWDGPLLSYLTTALLGGGAPRPPQRGQCNPRRGTGTKRIGLTLASTTGFPSSLASRTRSISQHD